MIPGFSSFPEGQIILFALIFLRAVSFVATWPIFGVAAVPMPLKILFSLVLSMIMFPSVRIENIEIVKIGDQIIALAGREVLIGLMLGFLMRMIFMAVQIGAEVISLSMGLSAAQVFNPASGHSSNLIDQFQSLLASLFFFTLNGHHFFIQGMAQSFQIAPIGHIGFNTDSLIGIVPVVTEIIVIGLKISAPIVVAILITNVAMGILGRAIPQINVLVTSMPVTFMGGLFLLMVITPYFFHEVNFVSELMATQFFRFLRVI